MFGDLTVCQLRHGPAQQESDGHSTTIRDFGSDLGTERTRMTTLLSGGYGRRHTG